MSHSTQEQHFSQVAADLLMDMSEVWVLADKGSPFVVPEVVEAILSRHNHELNQQLVYLVANRKIGQVVNNNLLKRQNRSVALVIFTSSVTLPDLAIRFEPDHSLSNPHTDTLTLIRTSASLRKVSSQGLQSLFDCMGDAGLLTKDKRFSWPLGEKLLSLGEGISFELMYEAK